MRDLLEVLRLKIDPEQFDDCHLLTQFWHVSTTPKKNAAFAFAYLKLTTESGAAVPDTEHTVPTFKQERKPEEKNDAYYLKGDGTLLGLLGCSSSCRSGRSCDVCVWCSV